MAKLYDEIVLLDSPRLAALNAFNTMPDRESCVKLGKGVRGTSSPQRQILIYQKSLMCSALLALRIARTKRSASVPFSRNRHQSIHPSKKLTKLSRSVTVPLLYQPPQQQPR